MACMNCFCVPDGKRKKDKGGKRSSKGTQNDKNLKNLQVKLEDIQKPLETDEVRLTSCSVPVPFFTIPVSSRCNVKVMNHESPRGAEVEELAYEGGDEHDEKLSMKRDNSDSDLQANLDNENDKGERATRVIDIYGSLDDDDTGKNSRVPEKDAEEGDRVLRSGHISDPGIGKTEFQASPNLKRSCSDLGMRSVFQQLADRLPLSKSASFEEIKQLAEGLSGDVARNSGSPLSVKTHCSADKVMLKKHSSSQILPSRSRRLWWKLFLWSHRNLHRENIMQPQPQAIEPTFNKQGGYASDILEPRRTQDSTPLGSPCSMTGESFNNGDFSKGKQKLDRYYEVSSFWPQNHWVAFPAESSLARVDEWVQEVSEQPHFLIENDDLSEDGINFAPSPENDKSPGRISSHLIRHQALSVPEEMAHANTVIQTLNSSSTVAHITSVGLKVIPSMSSFSSLRSVNLSGNFIERITPGSLPKGLHILNLSRNKISTIEGLRELTRLRVLDLSYNRISRIGQGLSNCTLIKELYLAGNKISNVEGLHRLLKLTILDLSFNKITTTKALGQLVANYNTLIALNLLGNPVQSNINDDQLRKTVCGVLPKLAFLNKQPINPQKAREVSSESIAKAALGSSSRNIHRRASRRVGQVGSSSSSSVRRGSMSGAGRSSHRSRARNRYHSSSRDK